MRQQRRNWWNDKRINKGGWVIDGDHEVPTKGPPKELVTAYRRDMAEWERKQKVAEKLAERVRKEAEKAGLEFHDEDDYGQVISAGDPPEEPDDVDDPRTPLDRAIQEYRETGSVDALRRAAELGCSIVYSFSGMSCGNYPPTKQEFLRDGPTVPAGIKVVPK